MTKICLKGVRFILDNARVLHPAGTVFQAGQGCSRQGPFSSDYNDYQHLPAFHLGITKTTQEGVIFSVVFPLRVKDQTHGEWR